MIEGFLEVGGLYFPVLGGSSGLWQSDRYPGVGARSRPGLGVSKRDFGGLFVMFWGFAPERDGLPDQASR